MAAWVRGIFDTDNHRDYHVDCGALPGSGHVPELDRFYRHQQFFLIFYLAMGRGWHRDLLRFLSFDRSLGQVISVIEPGNRIIIVELLVAVICVYVHLQLNGTVNIWHPATTDLGHRCTD